MSEQITDRRIRLGMVGGGEGAFIGGVHRIAARLDDRYQLVAGALSSDPERARRSGAALGLDPARSYSDFVEMARAEAARPDGIQAVSIVTPNHLHAPVATAFLQAGIHVICDKPITRTLAEAEALAEQVAQSGALFVLTHTYTGYAMIRQARAMVAAGALGPIRVVQVEYPQDWLTEPVSEDGTKQALWRVDPERAGAAGALGDIGTHAMNLASFVTGLEAREICAELTRFVPGRQVDDDVQMMIRYDGGAKGMLWASQVAPGNENALKLRVYGAQGGLEWAHTAPDTLRHTPFGEPPRLLSRGGPGLAPEVAALGRVPAGHPEGFLEAFATLYSDAADAILAHASGAPASEGSLPGVADGVQGMRFVEAALRSSDAGGIWCAL
ncbi:oxidoreductase [Thioclava dalianensis]|uniref:Oxidoreductase n=1 Tax=Thioclava dalianensis TaxID=1185766 RepID=A0A074U779_9RHOB|nr:Gfo/Idh/MocA family oxidoreductase [Thioclava dalianensis]KEP70542.1 oxidoreductase [Thioclava dalianensis]SFN07878.1 Predicted dehydrogenase [Thioclava dalianensis]